MVWTGEGREGPGHKSNDNIYYHSSHCIYTAAFRAKVWGGAPRESVREREGGRGRQTDGETDRDSDRDRKTDGLTNERTVGQIETDGNKACLSFCLFVSLS